MTILENGEYRDATLEELEAFEEDAARAAAAERHRPLTAEEVTRHAAGSTNQQPASG